MDPSNHICSTNRIKIWLFRTLRATSDLPPNETVEDANNKSSLITHGSVSENFTAGPNSEPCQLLMGNRYARYVCLIPLDSLKCHFVISSLALTAWLTTQAKGSLCGVCRKHSRAHFSCGRHNLSSRQQLKDINTGSIQQRAGESFHFFSHIQNRSIKGASRILLHLVHKITV